MKFTIKPTYLIIGATLALAACSNEDFPVRTDGGDNRVVFRTSLPELTTRANVVTTENLPYFYVTGFDVDDWQAMSDAVLKPLFANQKIFVSGAEAPYSSANCCWPDPTKETDDVAFFAFYPGVSEVAGSQLINASTLGSVNYKLTGFRVVKDIADQVDFITAYAAGTMAENLFSGIDLPFAHQLSRIEIKAHGKHKSCDIEIAGVRIGGTGIENTFDFRRINGGGEWLGVPKRGIVEYLYRAGDKIVTFGKSNPLDKDNAVSIMGSKRADGNENCAMLIPGNYAQWDHANDRINGSNQMYISVLIRITDATLTDGVKPTDKQRYPYRDLTQGADAYDIPKEYFAVNKATGVVSAHVYKSGESYFADSNCTEPYTLQASDEIKEFGWAALPVEGNWAPGNIYTYTLDYTVGVGLHDPSVTTTAPGAGDPVISDKVGITYTVTEWKEGGGSSFVVPGS